MRVKKLTPIIVSLIVLAVITAILVRYRSVEAQQDRAAKAPITAKAALQQTTEEGHGFAPSPGPEVKSEKNSDLVLDADEVERRAAQEQASDTTAAAAAAASLIPISFKAVALPVQGGIDHVAAGVATRNSGQGVIRLRGVPPGSQLLGALLVWGEIAPAAFPNAVFGRDCGPLANVAGVTLPPAPQPNWVFGTSFWGYVADVRAQVAAVPGINGDYRVSLRTGVNNGRCAVPDGNCPPAPLTLPLSEGASLVVIYSNLCVPRNSQLFFDVGPQTFSGASINNHFTGVIRALPNMKHTRIGGDGQLGVANCGLRTFITPFIQGSDERTWVENLFGGASIQIKGDGGGLNRDSDWNGYDGETLNKLWDTHTDAFDNRLAGQIGYRVRYQSTGDTIVWVMHVLGVK